MGSDDAKLWQRVDDLLRVKRDALADARREDTERQAGRRAQTQTDRDRAEKLAAVSLAGLRNRGIHGVPLWLSKQKTAPGGQVTVTWRQSGINGWKLQEPRWPMDYDDVGDFGPGFLLADNGGIHVGDVHKRGLSDKQRWGQTLPEYWLDAGSELRLADLDDVGNRLSNEGLLHALVRISSDGPIWRG